VDVFSLRRPSESALARLIDEQKAQGQFSYAEVGATAASLPDGYRHDRWQADLGADDGDRFRRASEALGRWQAQRGAGVRVFPDEPVMPDATFALVIPTGFLYVTAVGRLVYIVDEPDRFAFAYGTLSAHPEQGEEAFAITREDGRVRFEIVSFSRPRHPLARIGAPVTRAMQVRVTRAYLEAIRSAAG
jgi:uncharacterized protein (UPF0548 family)